MQAKSRSQPSGAPVREVAPVRQLHQSREFHPSANWGQSAKLRMDVRIEGSKVQGALGRNAPPFGGEERRGSWQLEIGS